MRHKLRWRLSTFMLIVAAAGIVTWLKAPEWSRAYRTWLADRATNNLLDTPMPFDHPDGVPLYEFTIEASRRTSGAAFPKGLPIHIDPEGLQANDITIAAMVKINSQDAPLRRSLEHVLDQLDLSYRVDAGVVMITSKSLAKP
ncbi:hypothetical protein P12x_000906 [Tundrisphaera lichenicola]|uniref:hypothetical protein n=1 Tax=Tundrisphaera lichenicola TaxID=2029860 RepID=UPI003EB73A05